MADKQYSVYYLSDPDTNQVRYVGCSCRPFDRYFAHLAARGDGHKANWIRKLAKQGKLPKFSVKCILESEKEMLRVERAPEPPTREKP